MVFTGTVVVETKGTIQNAPEGVGGGQEGPSSRHEGPMVFDLCDAQASL